MNENTEESPHLTPEPQRGPAECVHLSGVSVDDQDLTYPEALAYYKERLRTKDEKIAELRAQLKS